jgi:hypothetical protein
MGSKDVNLFGGFFYSAELDDGGGEDDIYIILFACGICHFGKLYHIIAPKIVFRADFKEGSFDGAIFGHFLISF